MLRVHVETSADAELSSTLDELVAEGARRMLAAALEAEVDAYVASFTDERRMSRVLWDFGDGPTTVQAAA
jgi:hypothetical protein